jgi:hypothetical protein
VCSNQASSSNWDPSILQSCIQKFCGKSR